MFERYSTLLHLFKRLLYTSHHYSVNISVTQNIYFLIRKYYFSLSFAPK